MDKDRYNTRTNPAKIYHIFKDHVIIRLSETRLIKPTAYRSNYTLQKNKVHR